MRRITLGNIDKNRIVGTLYDDYVAAIYTSPEPMHDEQELQVQAAFFAGVFGILTFIEDNTDDSNDVTPDEFSMIQSIFDELQAQQKILVERMNRNWKGPHS